MSQAEAELSRSRLGAEQAATSDVAGARANVEVARANHEKAQSDLNRMRPLAAKEEISRQQFDSFQSAARVAEAQLRAAQQKLTAAEQTAQTSAAGVHAAQAAPGERPRRPGPVACRAAPGRGQHRPGPLPPQAAIQQARANLAAAELQLGYTTVTAPAEGVVTRKTVEPGQTVQPGQGLMTVIPLHDVWVTANFKGGPSWPECTPASAPR